MTTIYYLLTVKIALISPIIIGIEPWTIIYINTFTKIIIKGFNLRFFRSIQENSKFIVKYEYELENYNLIIYELIDLS